MSRLDLDSTEMSDVVVEEPSAGTPLLSTSKPPLETGEILEPTVKGQAQGPGRNLETIFNSAPSGQPRVGMKLTAASSFQNMTVNMGDSYHHDPSSPPVKEVKVELRSTGKIGNFNFDLTPLQGVTANRDREVGQIRAALANEAASGAKIAILVGIGGSGKTSLAKMYKRLETMSLVFKNQPFENLIWIEAEKHQTVTSAFMNLAHKDSLKVDSSFNPEHLAEVVYNSILRHRTIIVFDNVENVEDTKKFLPKHIPSGSIPPCILITTRVTEGWRDYKKHVVYVTELSSRASKDYIHETLAGIPDVDDKWEELAEHFGRLVVALRAASLFIVEQENKLQLLGQTYTIQMFLNKGEGTKEILQQEPLRSLWTLDSLAERPCGQVAQRILTVLAFMSSPQNDVPVGWFPILLADCPQYNEKNLMEEIKFLCSWSLVKRRLNGNYSVHRVLQMTLLSRIRSTPEKREETLDWLLPAVQRLRLDSSLHMRLSIRPNLHVLLRNMESDTLGNIPDSLVSFLVHMNQSGMDACEDLLDKLIRNVDKEVASVSPVSLQELEDVSNCMVAGRGQNLKTRFSNLLLDNSSELCCCGSNRGWLTFLVGFNIIVSILIGLMEAIGIAHELDHETASQQHFLKILVFTWVVYAIIILISVLPIVAEITQKPKFHLIYRNWTILLLILQVLWLIAVLDEIGPQLTGLGRAVGAGNSPVNRIVSLLVTIFTLILVQRRMNELREEIGHFSFLRFR